MILTLEPWLAFLMGLLVGSFLNVCIHRLPQDIKVWDPARSLCPKCGNTLAWYDNIPVLSYLLLRGKCRHCGAPISWRYPVVELMTAILFTLVALSGIPGIYMAKFMVFMAIMVTLIFSDFEERFLPDVFTLGGTVVGLVFAWFAPINQGIVALFLEGSIGKPAASLVESAFAAGFLGGLLWILGEAYYRVRKREGLGLGDVKMVATLGAFLGLQGVILSLMLASILGVVLGLGYLLFARKDFSTYELPLGSFLGIAGIFLVYYLRDFLIPA